MDAIKEFLKPELVWFLVGIVLLVMEFTMPGLIVFFFGVGACVVAAICFFADISLNAQLIIFIVSSVVLLVCLRKWIRGIFVGYTTSQQDMTANLEEFAGKKAVVIKDIKPNITGKVELNGTNWKAEADQEIAEGTIVEVIEMDNLTLKVKAL